MQIIAIFESARNVIRAEKTCRTHGLQVKVMPVPEDLSSECGMCLQISVGEVETLKKLMSDTNINVTIHNNG